jgi:hypothetical protein
MPAALNTPERIVADALVAFPDMRLVLEVANRARELEQMTPPRNFGMSTEIISSPYLGSPEIQNSTQSTLFLPAAG